MAIQFICSGCRQPIEVDPEWAGQTVMCPYCRYVQTAPAESTFRPEAVRPASPVRPPVPGEADGAFGTVAPPPPAGSRPTWPPAVTGAPAEPDSLGRASAVLGVLAWCLLIGGLAIALPLFRDAMESVRPLLKSSGGAVSEQELNRKLEAHIQEKMMTDAAFRVRAVKASLVVLLAEACGVAGLIVGLVGLGRRRARRAATVLGLVVCGLFLPGQCVAFGVMLRLAMA